MQTVHLQIEDDYIEDFMKMLPRDKVVVIEEDFKDNRGLLQKELQKYRNGRDCFRMYYDSMTLLSSWLQEKEG